MNGALTGTKDQSLPRRHHRIVSAADELNALLALEDAYRQGWQLAGCAIKATGEYVLVLANVWETNDARDGDE